MKISMVTVAYGALTEEMIQSALISNNEVELIIFTHSNNERISRLVHKLEGGQVVLKDYRQNRGLAKSWNEGIMMSQPSDVTIVFNDDITFSPGDVDLIANTSAENPHNFIVTCAGWNEVHQARMVLHGLACFAIQKIAIDTVGYFDENFWPAYFEDNDFWRRCTLAGLSHINCAETNVIHKGSQSLRNNPRLSHQNHSTFPANEQYYFRKWGGGPREEMFETPFDDPSFDLVIPRDKVGSPYGDYDRPMPRLTRLI